MFRRVAMPTVATRPMATAQMTGARRSYYYPGTGEQGIWGETLKRFNTYLTFMGFIGWPFFIYKVIWRKYNPDRQFMACTTDKWYSDGTELQGEEATANLRLHRERIMPIMDSYLEKIEASKA